MPVGSREIAAALPYLRRYARALTGNQGIGDQYVRIMLEMIVEDPSHLPDQGDVGRELFRLFHRVWDKTNPSSLYGEVDQGAVDSTLRELPPRQRQVLALAIRGVPVKLISRQLGIAEGTVKVHLSMVYRALGARNRTDALCRVFEAQAAGALESP